MIEKYERGKWVKLDKKREIDKILDLNNRKKGGEKETYLKNLKIDYGSLIYRIKRNKRKYKWR